jgi:hypothetical protein
MPQDQFVGIFSLMAVVSVLAGTFLRQRNVGKKRILITDYRRGVHFVKGSFKSVLGPGSYRYDPRNEQLTIVDMRPQPILIERLAFQDALRQEAVISVGTELLVRDPRLAATALRDQVKDSYVIVRDTLRTVVAKQMALSRENSPAVAESITKAVNTELAKVGMAVSEIELTELWSRSLQPQVTVGSRTVQ